MAKGSHHKAWFVSVRGSYLPASGIGLVIYLLYASYIIAVGIAWYSRGCDVWSLLTITIPLTVGAALVTQYIASRNSK
jgi:hypothetical protein